MRFKRKPRNRRFERQHVLDVKLRTREVRNARLRLAGVALSLSAGAIVVLFVLWKGGEALLNQFIFQNTSFAIRELDIETDGRLSREQIAFWSGVKAGDNLLALDLARVRRDLELVTCVRAVAVERIVPQTLRIRVTERLPLAQVKIPRFLTPNRLDFVTYFVDESGAVMDSAPGPGGNPGEIDGLPALVGISNIVLIPGRQASAPALLAAMRLLGEFEGSPMAGCVSIDTIDVSPGLSLLVTTTQGSQITFALDRVEQQVRRWHAVHEFARNRGRAIKALDLSVTNNSPALWVDASSVPADSPRARPAARNKRKNV